MATSEINFQFAQPGHLPAVIEMLEAEGMRDLRRDNIPILAETIVNRPEAIIVGTNQDREVVASIYVGDILPLLSALVVRPDCRRRGYGKAIMDIAERVLAGMGHRYTEIVVGDSLIEHYQHIGYYVTDVCTLMERPIAFSNETLGVPPVRPKLENTFDFKRRYRPDIYHKAFSLLARTCLDDEINTTYIEKRPPVSYSKSSPQTRMPVLKEGDHRKYEGLITGRMIPIDDKHLREKGVLGWAAFEDGDLEILKALEEEFDTELPIWTPLKGELWCGVHFVRSKGDTKNAILPVRTNSSMRFHTLRDIPSNLNLLVASAQKLMHDQIALPQ